MGSINKFLKAIFRAEGIYATITNPWVATVAIPAASAFVASLMAWFRGVPWLEIYVIALFVAACASVLIRQLLDRWQATTDRDKLVYQGINFGIKYKS